MNNTPENVNNNLINVAELFDRPSADDPTEKVHIYGLNKYATFSEVYLTTNTGGSITVYGESVLVMYNPRNDALLVLTRITDIALPFPILDTRHFRGSEIKKLHFRDIGN